MQALVFATTLAIAKFSYNQHQYACKVHLGCSQYKAHHLCEVHCGKSFVAVVTGNCCSHYYYCYSYSRASLILLIGAVSSKTLRLVVAMETNLLKMFTRVVSRRLSSTTGAIGTVNNSGRGSLRLKLNPLWTLSKRHVGTISSRTFASQLLKPMYKEEEDSLEEDSPTRQAWFIFSGLGSQRNVLPKELYSLEPFAESLKESRRILKGLGINMDEHLDPENNSIYTCIRSALISLSVIQMALYETLKHMLPAEPSGLIGHSAGEALCGYADGSLSAEQVLLISEARARAMLVTKKYSGGMAAIGLSLKEISPLCPPDIYPACINAPNAIIVSGSAESIKSFIKELQGKKIFAKEVDSCDFAPHSPHVEEASHLLREYMKQIIPNKVRRSSKWISTSAREEDWDSPEVQFVSGEYFVNNIKDQVLFHQALLHIPNGAVVIEISPKALFGGILKGAVPDTSYFAPILKNDILNPTVLSKEDFQSIFRQS
ncbi:unnamed protein product [Allacma fusca]|uniref:Malonyl-CoA:ACP transacylase (MAT) domain-containing protein n=1 Tax=Allacma fusca TaxID=39272 RepID=A0A8J2P8Q0_9HEXA|nr:unnamed protein product [Allacma fusca]